MTLQLSEDIAVRKIAGRCVVVPIGKNIDAVKSIYNLNESAQRILELIQEGLEESEIKNKLLNEFDIQDTSALDGQIENTLKEFREYGILL